MQRFAKIDERRLGGTIKAATGQAHNSRHRRNHGDLAMPAADHVRDDGFQAMAGAYDIQVDGRGQILAVETAHAIALVAAGGEDREIDGSQAPCGWQPLPQALWPGLSHRAGRERCGPASAIAVPPAFHPGAHFTATRQPLCASFKATARQCRTGAGNPAEFAVSSSAVVASVLMRFLPLKGITHEEEFGSLHLIQAALRSAICHAKPAGEPSHQLARLTDHDPEKSSSIRTPARTMPLPFCWRWPVPRSRFWALRRLPATCLSR